MKGIVFTKEALQGSDGSANSSGRSTAIAMARGQCIRWYEPSTGNPAFSITSSANTATRNVLLDVNDGGGSNATVDWYSEAGIFAKFRGTAGKDYIVLQSSSGAARINGEGDSTNIDIFLTPKGTGSLRFGIYTPTSDTTCNGYIEIKDQNGNIRKLMTTN